MLSRVQLSLTPWTVAHQAPLSMGFPRQAYWSGLPFPPPRDVPNPGIKPTSPVSPELQEDSSPAEPSGKPQKGRIKETEFKNHFLGLEIEVQEDS